MKEYYQNSIDQVSIWIEKAFDYVGKDTDSKNQTDRQKKITLEMIQDLFNRCKDESGRSGAGIACDVCKSITIKVQGGYRCLNCGNYVSH